MTPPPPGNPRQTEAWALTQAALRLKGSQQAADPEPMRDAARLNWRLWTIIQSDLLDPGSPVPLDIRNSVLSLARFVDARTVDFLGDPVPAKLDALIAINRELAAGLYAPGPAAAAPASAAEDADDPRGGRSAPMRISI